MKLLIKDDFFESPTEIRNVALSLENYRVDNDFASSQSGWRGERSLPLSRYNIESLDNYSKNIFNICYEYFDLSNYVFPYFNEPIKNLTITTYFHITTEETKQAFPDFWQDRLHKDPWCPCAGIVYLNENAPLKSGTIVFDGENNQMINVDNKFNRLVAYDGHKIHGLADVFGTSRETGRLTFNFFIHESDEPLEDE